MALSPAGMAPPPATAAAAGATSALCFSEEEEEEEEGRKRERKESNIPPRAAKSARQQQQWRGKSEQLQRACLTSGQPNTSAVEGEVASGGPFSCPLRVFAGEEAN